MRETRKLSQVRLIKFNNFNYLYVTEKSLINILVIFSLLERHLYQNERVELFFSPF